MKSYPKVATLVTPSRPSYSESKKKDYTKERAER